MCDWGGGPYGMTGYKPPDRGHHESDREFAERVDVPGPIEAHVPFPGQPPVQQGWQCPVCGIVNAPFMPICGNNANHGKTITTTHT